jgi:hypothetical protein
VPSRKNNRMPAPPPPRVAPVTDPVSTRLRQAHTLPGDVLLRTDSVASFPPAGQAYIRAVDATGTDQSVYVNYIRHLTQPEGAPGLYGITPKRADGKVDQTPYTYGSGFLITPTQAWENPYEGFRATGPKPAAPVAPQASPRGADRPRLIVPGNQLTDWTEMNSGVPVVLSGTGGRHFKNYQVQFPLTPESIPVQTAAIWNDVQIVGLGERASFGGRALDNIAFSGVLEWGTIVGSGEVLMPQLGSTGGHTYWQPGFFRQKLRAAMKDGEILGLRIGQNDVQGEETPWDGFVSIRDFTWRFEDPDPAVIYYDISFKQHQERGLYGVPEKIPRHQKVVTRDNDSLGAIATREFKDRGKWSHIRNLNKSRIGALWLATTGHDKLYKKKSSTAKINVTANNIENKIDPNTRFEGGIELYMEKR